MASPRSKATKEGLDADGVRNFGDAPDDIPFRVGGYEYHASGEAPGGAFLALAAVESAEGNVEKVQTVLEFFKSVLHGDSYDTFARRFKGEAQALIDAADEVERNTGIRPEPEDVEIPGEPGPPIGLTKAMEIFGWLVERYTGADTTGAAARPTRAASRSRSGSGATGTSSTASASSAASEPAPPH